MINADWLRAGALTLVMMVSAGPVPAQLFKEETADTTASTQQPPQYQTEQRANDAPPEPPPIRGALPTIADFGSQPSEKRPFGHKLFSGGFQVEREDGFNPEYVIAPGDRISLRLWGAAKFQGQLVVDAQGNIFVPEIGPISIAGTRNADLTGRIVKAVSTVFTSNVNVYTHLQGTRPVVVFVTGFVNAPGSYAGVASDSLLYFLTRAGGIDDRSGSYRKVLVKRNSKVLAEADLYRFLSDGEIPRLQFRDGDTIVVTRRGGSIAAAGRVRVPSVFEIPEGGISGLDLMDLARPEADASHALLVGSRADASISKYVDLAALGATMLRDGDEVVFEADRRDREILVRVQGSHIGPSSFSVPNDTTLRELLDHIEVDPDLADTGSISLRRDSVAKRQRQALEESLRRLETTVLGATSQTDAESEIRVEEAKLITQFVERAKNVEPKGILVVAGQDGIADLRLEPGDVVNIPPKSRVVLVSGEVMVPQALVHERGASFEDYINRVGGYTDRAEQSRYMIIRRNGEVEQGDFDLARHPDIREGDELMVLPRVPVKNLQTLATIMQIIFQIALSTATVAGL